MKKLILLVVPFSATIFSIGFFTPVVVQAQTATPNLVSSIDPTSPSSQTTQISATTTTNNVPIVTYDLLAQNQSANLQGFVLGLQFGSNSGLNYPASAFFKNFALQVNGQTYYGTINTTQLGQSTVVFSNMNIPLPVNQNVPLKILTTVNPGVNDLTASVMLCTAPSCAGNLGVNSIITATSSNNTLATIQNVGDLDSATASFLSTVPVTIEGVAVNSPTFIPSSNPYITGNVAGVFPFVFSVYAGPSSVYISANPASAFAASGPVGSTITPVSITAGYSNVPSKITGDTNTGTGTSATGSYIVPANSSRAFMINVLIDNSKNTSNVNNGIVQMTGVYWSLNSTPASSTISTTSEMFYTSNMGGLRSNPFDLVSDPPVMVSVPATPTIVQQNISAGAATSTTFLYTSTFNVRVIAGEQPITIGWPNSSFPAFGASTTPLNIVQPYVNGAAVSSLPNGAPIIASYGQSSSTNTFFTLPANQTMIIPVTYTFVEKNPGANVFGLQLLGMNYTVNGTSGLAPISNACTPGGGSACQSGVGITTPVLSVTTSTSSLIYSWPPIPNVLGYIFVETTPTASSTFFVASTSASYVYNGPLTPNTQYCGVLTANINNNGYLMQTNSVPVCITTPAASTAPLVLTTASTTSSSILYNWSSKYASSTYTLTETSPIRYQLYQGINSSYLATGFNPSTNYCATLTVNTATTSASVCTSTLAGPPTLTITSVNSSGVIFNWSDTDPAITNYQFTETLPTFTVLSSSTATTFDTEGHSNIPSGTKFCASVIATNASNVITTSNIVCTVIPSGSTSGGFQLAPHALAPDVSLNPVSYFSASVWNAVVDLMGKL